MYKHASYNVYMSCLLHQLSDRCELIDDTRKRRDAKLLLNNNAPHQYKTRSRSRLTITYHRVKKREKPNSDANDWLRNRVRNAIMWKTHIARVDPHIVVHRRRNVNYPPRKQSNGCNGKKRGQHEKRIQKRNKQMHDARLMKELVRRHRNREKRVLCSHLLMSMNSLRNVLGVLRSPTLLQIDHSNLSRASPFVEWHCSWIHSTSLDECASTSVNTLVGRVSFEGMITPLD